MIAIHRGSNILLSVGVNQGSIRRYNLMKEDFIRLKFSLTENKPLLIGDYVDLTDYINSCDNENFRIKDENTDQTTKKFVVDRNYYPTFNKNTGGWDYDVQINAYYHQWKNKIFMYNPSKGSAESSFSLTDTIFTHAALLVKNLKYAGFTYNNTEFNVAYQEEFEGQLQAKGMKPITYSAVSIYGALDMIAQAFECEWWLDGGSTIYFGYRKGDETTTLTLNDEIADASISDSDGVHATRIYAFGGTTNVPKHYRDKLEFKVSETAVLGTHNVMRDKSKPVVAEWFRNRYKEASKTLSISGISVNNNGEQCHVVRNVSPTISGGDIQYSFQGSIAIEPIVYGIYSYDGDNPPTVTINQQISLSADAKGELYYSTPNKVIVLRNPSLINGTKLDTNHVGNYDYVKVTAGKTYIVIGDTYDGYSGKRDILFSKSSNGDNAANVWTFSKQGYVCYYRATEDGYLFVTARRDIVEPKIYESTDYISYDLSIDEEFSKVTPAWESIVFRCDVDSISSLALDDVNEFKYRMKIGNMSIPTQRLDEAATTKINIGGEERTAIINPTFLHDDVSHWVEVDGYSEKSGEVFTFPEILISKVSREAGHYFTQEDGGIQSSVVQKNIMLPKGTDYVQAEGVSDSDVVEAIVVYDWIYPKSELVVESVEPFDKWAVEEGEETTYVTTYDITLPITGWNWDDCVVGENLYMVFQNGKASGLRFEVQEVKSTSTNVTFRLTPNEDYAVWIPNDATIPATGDKIILDGIDITFFDTNAIANAEAEVLAQANKDIIETSKEDKVVDITLASDYAYNKGRIALGTLTSLIDVLSSEDNAYDSRILGFEECLDIPWDKPKYIIGDKNYYNRQASIESKLENIEKGSITLSGVNTGGGGSNIPIIKVKDNTKPTDANVYSALRSREEFAKRKEEETFSEKVTFNKDIDVKGTAKAKNLSVSGNASVGGTQTVSGSQTIGGNQRIEGNTSVGGDVTIGSYTDTAGAVQGAKITKDGVGTFAGLKSKYFEIYELIYNIQTAEDGIKSFSDNGIIEEVLSVVEEASGASPHKFTHRITLKMRELRDGYLITFKPDDVIFGYVHNVGDSGSSAMGGQSWMLVRSIDNDTLTMKVMLYDQGELLDDDSITYILPTASMTITRWGNRTDTERQNTFYISTEQGNIVQLMGVTHPKIDVGNIGTVTGLLPSDLLAEVQKRFSYINPKQPYFYGRGMIVQDLMEMDYLGNPIKKERYRGEWSKAVAMSDEPYTIAISTYDTVTHNGSLWMCQQSGTISEPSDTSTEWIKKVSKGSDASAVIYEIKPSANIVYVKGGSLSTNNLDVTIGRTDSNGHFDIADQAYLDSVGLLVQWAIDGGERHDLNISPDEPIDLEDESGELLAENGNALLLEGETIDISSIKDNITLYLVDTTTGNDMAERIIPVVKDGSNYEVRFTPSLISHPVDATTLATIGSGSYITSVTLFSDGKEVSLQHWGYSAVGNKDITITPRYSVPNKSLLLKIDIEDGIAKSNQATNITLTLTPPSGSEGYPESIVGSMSIVYPQRGPVGQAGEVGPLLFPSGRLEFGVEYDVVYDVTYTSKVVAQPFFYNQTDEVYYVLQKKITAAENTEANLGNTDYWRPFTKIQYLFTEALMANWAKLAKFIFYAEFMFSQQGTNISGDEGLDWSSVAERMFVKDEDGNIIGWKGEFIPNTMIDALRGIISCGKFIEQFDYFTSGNIYRIDLNKAHNVYIPYKEANLAPMYYVSQFNSYPNLPVDNTVYDGRMGYYTVPTGTIGNEMQEIWYRYYKSVSPARFVTLPEFSEEMATAIAKDLETGTIHETMWLEDGTHVCIMHELSAKAMNPEQNESGNADFESPVIVFPDNSVLDISNYSATNSSGKYEMGGYSPSIESYFVWRGIRVSAVILAPGTMLKLRSSHVKYNGKNIRLWYVENSSDFDVTAMTLNVGVTNSNIEVRGTTKVDFHLDPIGWRDYGRTVIGSCMMNQTLRKTSISEGTSTNDKDLAYKDTIKTTLYNIYPHALYADENSAMTYTLLFYNVTVAEDGSLTMNDGGIVQCHVSNTALVNTLDNKAGVSYTGVKEK